MVCDSGISLIEESSHMATARRAMVIIVYIKSSANIVSIPGKCIYPSCRTSVLNHYQS
jgi:hypothetical protein